jgi:hypothetical protein
MVVRMLTHRFSPPLLFPRARTTSSSIPSRRLPSCRRSGRFCRPHKALRSVPCDARYLPVRSPLETEAGSAFMRLPGDAPPLTAAHNRCRRLAPPPPRRPASLAVRSRSNSLNLI